MDQVSPSMRERLKREQQAAKEFVHGEFFDWDHDDPVAQAMHAGPHEHVFGGTMSMAPQELQLVQAWRPSPAGVWELAQGVVHRVHREDDTVTVQFLPDQHRCRLPAMCVKPQLDITPVYPTIRLPPGARLPTRSEIELREHNANVQRKLLGIAPDAPLPESLGGEGEGDGLLPGEHYNAEHVPFVEGDHWGIPAPTLDALRNRSVPAAQVGSVYCRHFYTELYRNRFYPQTLRRVSDEHEIGLPQSDVPKSAKPRVVSHQYIPLSGPKLELDMQTQAWRPVVEERVRHIEGPGWLG